MLAKYRGLTLLSFQQVRVGVLPCCGARKKKVRQDWLEHRLRLQRVGLQSLHDITEHLSN